MRALVTALTLYAVVHSILKRTVGKIKYMHKQPQQVSNLLETQERRVPV